MTPEDGEGRVDGGTDKDQVEDLPLTSETAEEVVGGATMVELDSPEEP